MMNAIQYGMLAILLYLAGALVALVWMNQGRAARRTSVGLAALASLAAVLAAAGGIASGGEPAAFSPFSLPAFGAMTFQMDKLSALMVGLIGLIGLATSLYTWPTDASSSRNDFYTNLFMAAMICVVTAANAFYFFVFWEIMTLASYFLVIWESEKRESVVTGFIYFLVAHAGAVLIMMGVLLLFQRSGSFAFGDLRQYNFSSGLKNVVFVLFFLGFGAKAGMAPLHFWTPATYSAAPDHASALMAGVMKKTAIYGMLRFLVDLMGVFPWWWGFVIVFFGVFSTVLGAFYALTERHVKRLLAYSSVENVGIILMGVGLGMIGMQVGWAITAALGFLAALYHILNHAFFKALLFLGAGPVMAQAGTADLNRMGGLARRMPWTALAFLTGALAVAGVPPLNGFVSEWFTYQALFAVSQLPQFALRMFAPLFAVLLSLAGALAVMVYIKAYGGIFTGPARTPAAAEAREARREQRYSLAYLALGCLVLGLGAPLIAPWIASVASEVGKVSAITVSSGWQVFPGDAAQAILSPPGLALAIAGLLLAPLLLVALYGGWRAGRRRDSEPWACGYGYSARMAVSASSFDQPVKVSFHPLYVLRTLLDRPLRTLAGYSHGAVLQILRAEPVVETTVSRPTARLLEITGQWIQALQMGDIRLYCFYIILTLAILLIAIFGRSGL